MVCKQNIGDCDPTGKHLQKPTPYDHEHDHYLEPVP